MDVLTESIFEEPIYLIPGKTWVVLSTPWAETKPEEKVLLQKILSATGQSLESVTIQYQATLDLAAWPHKPQRLLFFGKAGSGWPQNEISTVDGTSVIISSSLADLQHDATAKQKLWQALKQLFKA